MKKNHTGKILAIGIIVLFIGVNIVTSASSVNSNIDEKAIGKSDVKPFDDSKEIITKIDGVCYDVFIHSKKGLFLDVTFYAGSWGTWFDLSGWKYPFPTFYHELVTHAHVSCFIGFIREHDYGNHFIYDIRGIAFGNIEWS